MSDRFAHRLRVDQIRDGERLDLVADEQERKDIGKRLGLRSVERLEAHVSLTKNGNAIRADGRLIAIVGQNCVVTGDPVTSHVDEPFSVMFLPEPAPGGAEDEIELGAADCDTVFYDGGQVDLGSAVGDTLALGVDPYPRCAAAESALKEAGVLTEDQASPFAILARLKQTQNDLA